MTAGILRGLAEMATFTTPSGQRLHVEESGRGRPLVAIHGWAMASAAMEPLLARLGGGLRTIRYDLRGHGRSAPAPTADLAAHAEDLAALLDGLGVVDAVVVGWSMGAQVALAAFPAIRGRVGALALIAGTPRFTAAEGWPHGLPARQVEVLAQRYRRDPARTRARFLADMLAPGEREALGDAALGDAMPLPDPAAAQAGLDLLATADLRPALPGIEAPVLLLHGEADPICPAGASAAMAEAIPGASLRLIPGAGHAPFLSREAEVAAAVAGLAGTAR